MNDGAGEEAYNERFEVYDRTVCQRHDFGGPSGCSALVLGESESALSALPPKRVQTVVTSPPYWSLRDYGIEGQIGLGEPIHDYLNSLAAVFDQVSRVLRDDGTLWLNLGDSYTSGNRAWRAPDKKNPARAMSRRPPTPAGLKEKDLIGLPWRLAFMLQARGWFLRSEVIWRKPNAQPESVRDRPTRDFEQIFLFSKKPRYKYSVEAVRGEGGRRLRTTWDIKTKPGKGAGGHIAAFPEELAERCIRITSAPGDLVLDPFMGSGTTAVAAARLKRYFLGIELNPKYVELSRRRLGGMGVAESAAEKA